MNPKRRIHKFKFEEPTLKNGMKTHVALVDRAANLTEALVIKSTYINQSTQVETYHDDGTYERDENRVSISDHGGDNIYITETQVRVVETAYPKIKIV